MSPAAPSADSIARLALERPPTLGSGRLVCVDGPAGSGKTTLGTAIARIVPGARLVHMDDLYAGWSGLEDVDLQLARLLEPLGRDRAGSYQRYDWHSGEFAESVVVAPGPMLVLEGVGSGASGIAELVTVLVWVEAPHDVRIARGLDRDGEAFAPHWEQWARDEAALFAREHTRERADVVVDGTRPTD